jgi:Ca2+-transporting ATPase
MVVRRAGCLAPGSVLAPWIAMTRANPNWHVPRLSDLVEQLDSNVVQGLDPVEAAERLARVGPNRLQRRRPRSAWRLFLDQFRSVLILVLLVAAGLAFAVGNVTDAVAILIVVLLNASLGYYQEHRAGAAVAALKGMLTGAANVRRGGQVERINRECIVPGDIVIAETA